MSTDTTDVANITSAGNGVANVSNQFIAYLKERADREGANVSFDVASGQVNKILTAETEEDIWAADELAMLSGQDLVDTELVIRSMTIHHSTNDAFENPWGIFAIVHADRVSDGEEVVFNTGAILLISKIRAFEARNMLPLECVIKGITAGKGTVLKLAPLPKRAERIKSN